MAEYTIWMTMLFEVHDNSVPPDPDYWPEVGGLYVFAFLETIHRSDGRWRAVYVGKACNFSKRLPNHEKWQEAEQLGATHVHLHQEDDDDLRVAFEQDLIKKYQPPLNVQHR